MIDSIQYVISSVVISIESQQYTLLFIICSTKGITMPDLTSVTHYPLKVIFIIHLILTTWGLQGHWCPQSAMFYNLLFFLCLLWSIHNVESDEPLQFALLINVLSMLFDVICLSIYFRDYDASERFSGVIMIINLLARVISSKYLLKIGQARGGSLASLFPSGAGIERQQYEDISYPQNNVFADV